MAATLTLMAPFAAWAAPLDEVPDAAFAGRMLGDGIALDPLEGVVRAPCDATVLAIAPTGHSITLRAAGGPDILIHVGIDTVALGGEGLETLVAVDTPVAAGTPVLRFDLDAVARAAPSLLTPVIVLTAGWATVPLALDRTVEAGEPVARITAQASVGADTQDGGDGEGETAERRVTVPLPHGIHARPAARIGAVLRDFTSGVRIACGGRSANARSVTALLALGVGKGDEILVAATGTDAQAAAEAVAGLIASGMGETGHTAMPASVAAVPVTIAAGEIAAQRAAPGGAIGTAFQLRIADRELPHTPGVPAAEQAQLDAAIDRLRRTLSISAAGDAIADAHLAILDDPELLAEARRQVASGSGAALAWRRATRAQATAIRGSGNDFLAERAADLIDVERRLIDVLLGDGGVREIDVPPGSVLVAEDLLPSEFLAIDAARLAAIVTAAGGPTSHVAILAAARGVPMLVSAGAGVLTIVDGTILVVDEARPVMAVAPSSGALAEHRARHEAAAARAEQQRRAALTDCRTADGVRIDVFANCGSADDAVRAAAAGAEGCGLLRTEFLFLGRARAPDETEQAAAYRAVADGLAGRPVIVRTLDAGSDKPLAFLPIPAEDNPALGLRGVRVSLATPSLLAEQFRAILRGVPAGQRKIMLPMVNDLGELRAARAILAQAEATLGIAEPTRLGIMVETPAAALLADKLALEADFLSVGSNDLAQYALAADRGNASVAHGDDALHPAVLLLIAQAAAASKAHGRWIGICGALASDIDAAPLLVGLGLDELSATPGAIPAIKARLGGTTMAECRALATAALAQDSVADVRRLIAPGGTANA